MDLQKYNKFWVACVAAAGVLIFACAPTEVEAAFTVTLNEWYMVLVGFAGALGVYQVPNKK